MKYHAIMFDLDGTLIDSLSDIANACNEALRELKLQQYPKEQYCYLAGQGVASLIKKVLGPDHQHLTQKTETLYKAAYAQYTKKPATSFQGISSLLAGLQKQKIPMAVLTNKHDQAAQITVTQTFGAIFDAVQGVCQNTPAKPDPAGAIKIATDLKIPCKQWVYVGDTQADMLTAKRAGMFAVGVKWGWRDETELRENGADLIVQQPIEILSLFTLK